MKIQAVKFAFAALTLTAVVACQHKSSSPNSTPAVAQSTVTRLNAEISKIQPGFLANDSTLSDKFDGISIESVDTPSPVKVGEFFVKGSILIKGTETPVAFHSEAMSAQSLKDGRNFDLAINDQSSITEAVGGMLSLKMRCIDKACKEVAIWAMSFQDEQMKSAGFILSSTVNGYVVTHSLNPNTEKVSDALIRTSNNARRDN